MTEQQVELRWGDLSILNSVNDSSFEIFLQYQEEAHGELDEGEEDRSRNSGDKKGTQSQSMIKKIVKVPISFASRGVTVAGLYPGSIYSFTLKACHPAGATWSLGQTRTAFTSESADSRLHAQRVHRQSKQTNNNILNVYVSHRTTSSSKCHCWPHYSESD